MSLRKILALGIPLLLGAALLRAVLLPRRAARPSGAAAAKRVLSSGFVDVAASAGLTLRYDNCRKGIATILEESGPGCAFLDYDNDGSLDILVSTNDGPPVLIRNPGTPGAHFLSLQLVGRKSNRDAVGARVWLTAGGLKQLRDVKSGGSYLSSSDPRLHFGLGGAGTADRIEVRWPSGQRQAFGPLPADAFLLWREGAPRPEPQTFQPPRPAGR